MKWLQRFRKDKPRPATPTTLVREPDGIYVMRVHGILNKASSDLVQAAAQRDIEAGARDLRLLILLEDFRGLKQGDDWGDIEFFVRYEAKLLRIAVVGDPRWEEDALVFLGAKRRTGEVRYFATGQEPTAREWLTGK